MNASDLSVAQTINLNYSHKDEKIWETEPSRSKIPVRTFVEKVFPQHQIEHLGFSSVSGFDSPREVRSSSLFFQALHNAYAGHHAFGIRPEALLYLITSVIAETVKRHPKTYRNLFTGSDKKLDIRIRHDGLVKGDPDAPWHEAIGMFENALDPFVPSNIMSEMLPKLSTETEVSRIASLVSFMDAATPFYNYHVATLCGIPRVILFGEPSDYRKVYESAQNLAEKFEDHLKVYFRHLLPVLEKIVRTAEGERIDERFWNQIYKHEDMSGGPTFGGWMSSFLWYISETERNSSANSLVVKSDTVADWTRLSDWNGLSSGSEPAHVSKVPFTWNYYGSPIPMFFIGGILGIDIENDALTPVLSYGVLNA